MFRGPLVVRVLPGVSLLRQARYNTLMIELSNIDDACSRCGLCLREQKVEGMPELMCGDLAEELLATQDLAELSPEAYEFIVSCALCNACTARCPQDISCAETVTAAREKLVSLDPEHLDNYRAYRVDYRENCFTVLRERAGYAYDDLLDAPFEKREQSSNEVSLFFSGCSLANYSEALTKATFLLLKQHGAVQGLSVHCCGKPLGDMGARDAQKHYGIHLVAALRQGAVNRLVVACPNCFSALQALFAQHKIDDIALEPLPRVLEALGIAYTGTAFARVSVHDSCPDRSNGLFAQSTRALLGLGTTTPEIQEMQNHGLHTICCGAGGMASLGNPALSTKRRARRLDQFKNTGAECLVCNCVSCVQALVQNAEAPPVHHYLELLLDIPIDWQAVQKNVDRVYLEAGEKLSLPLEQCTPVFANPTDKSKGT